MMAFEHIVLSHHMRGKVVNVALVGNRHTNKSRDVLPYFFRIQNRVVASNDAARFELFHSLHNGR